MLQTTNTKSYLNFLQLVLNVSLLELRVLTPTECSSKVETSQALARRIKKASAPQIIVDVNLNSSKAIKCFSLD